MALYQILYWKDIPAQVRASQQGGRPISRQLAERFQQEIDARAMREGLAGSDEYLEHWRWTEKRDRPGAPEEVLEAIVRELEQDPQLHLESD